jgi:hypothetical protein
VLLAAELRDRIFRIAPNSHRKHFIIVLSKLDELRQHDDWWATIMGHRWPDFPPTVSGLPEYFDRMEQLTNSQLLRNWWANDARQAHKFIKSLPQRTHFCALSSLGHQPVWDCPQCRRANPNALRSCGHCDAGRGRAGLRLMRKPEPFRVRDPLFWIFREAGVM